MLNTVNVVMTLHGIVHSLHSFSDDEAGNKQAEHLFSSLAVKEFNMAEDEIEAALDDGIAERAGYTSKLFLVHSTNTP